MSIADPNELPLLPTPPAIGDDTAALCPEPLLLHRDLEPTVLAILPRDDEITFCFRRFARRPLRLRLASPPAAEGHY